MKLKQFGCSFLFFLLALVLLFILLSLGDHNPAAFWWCMGGLAVAVTVAAVCVRKFGKKPASEEEPADIEDKPFVMVEKPQPAMEADMESAPAPAAQEALETPADASAENAVEAPAPAPEAEPAVPEGSNLMAAGEYLVGTDIPAGKYDFRALRGSGVLAVTKPGGAEKLSVNLGTLERVESAEYRNLVTEDGETLKITGSLMLAVRKSRMLVIE